MSGDVASKTVRVKVFSGGLSSFELSTALSRSTYLPQENLVIQVAATGSSSSSRVQGVLQLSVNDSSVQLAAISPSNATVSFDAVQIGAYFLIPARALPPASYLTFTVRAECSGSSETIASSVTIFVRRGPYGGELVVSPSVGSSLQDTFQFRALLWESDDMPLAFGFSYGQNASALLPLQVQSEVSVAFVRLAAFHAVEGTAVALLAEVREVDA
eukprot:gene22795-27806_t